MKTFSAFRLVLTLSLAANAGLIVFLGRTSGEASAGAKLATANSTADAAAKKSADRAASDSTAASPKIWDNLRTDDLATLVARLRAAGFPDLVVRRIISRLVNERFDARRLEIEKANLEAPFWTTTNTNTYMDPTMGPALRQLQREQSEMLKHLLGGNMAELFAGTDEDRAMLRQQIGNIAPEKLEQLYSTAMDFGDKMMAVYAGANGGNNRNIFLDSDHAKINALDQAYRADLGKFLSPSEVTDFMLHSGQISGQIRYQLAPMKLSEDEYRAVYPLYQTFQDQNPTANFSYLPPDASPAAHAAVDQLNAQIAATLGPDRAADFAQVSNYDYSQVNRLVARLDLPLSAAASVAAVQTDAQQRAAAIRADPSLKGADRSAQLNALAAEASGKISTALGGQSGLDAYKDNGGQWLTTLVPRPRGASAPAKD